MTASNYAVIVRFSGGGEAQRQIFGTLEGKRELKVKEASEYRRSLGLVCDYGDIDEIWV